MHAAHARTDLDQVIWADYVRLRNQAEVAELHGIAQQNVSAAIRRYVDAIPESEKREYRVRILDRYERVYQAWKDKADTSTRAANVVIRTLALQCRLLGLEPKELHVSGQVEHDHQVEHEPGPTMEQLLERWRAEGAVGDAAHPDTASWAGSNYVPCQRGVGHSGAKLNVARCRKDSAAALADCR